MQNLGVHYTLLDMEHEGNRRLWVERAAEWQDPAKLNKQGKQATEWIEEAKKCHQAVPVEQVGLMVEWDQVVPDEQVDQNPYNKMDPVVQCLDQVGYMVIMVASEVDFTIDKFSPQDNKKVPPDTQVDQRVPGTALVESQADLVKVGLVESHVDLAKVGLVDRKAALVDRKINLTGSKVIPVRVVLVGPMQVPVEPKVVPARVVLVGQQAAQARWV